MEREILYFGDPMCSWCWGFAPVLNRLDESFGETAPLRLIVGGLHAGDTEPMSDEYKATIRHHWEDVNKATGAEFDFGFFDREGFVLDTEPACRAAVTARTMAPGKTFSYYEAVARAFYTENRDTTALETFVEIAEANGLDSGEFADRFASDEMRRATLDDFKFSRDLGVTGFPTMVVREDDKLALLTVGYRPYETLAPAIQGWLDEGLEARVSEADS